MSMSTSNVNCQCQRQFQPQRQTLTSTSERQCQHQTSNVNSAAHVDTITTITPNQTASIYIINLCCFGGDLCILAAIEDLLATSTEAAERTSFVSESARPIGNTWSSGARWWRSGIDMIDVQYAMLR